MRDGSDSDTSTNSKPKQTYGIPGIKNTVESIPGTVLSASAITASFSTGFREQVEYTILPP